MIALPTRTRTIDIIRLYGFCPVQADGMVDGLPFYFHARFNRWVFAVASSQHGDPVRVAAGIEPGFSLQRTFGHDNDASFMSHLQAKALIVTSAQYYLNEVRR